MDEPQPRDQRQRQQHEADADQLKQQALHGLHRWQRACQMCQLVAVQQPILHGQQHRSEEHTSELQSLMRTSYAVFCLKKKRTPNMLLSTTQTLANMTSTRDHLSCILHLSE